MARISKQYTPDEINDVLSRLKDICNIFLSEKNKSDKTIEKLDCIGFI